MGKPLALAVQLFLFFPHPYQNGFLHPPAGVLSGLAAWWALEGCVGRIWTITSSISQGGFFGYFLPFHCLLY